MLQELEATKVAEEVQHMKNYIVEIRESSLIGNYVEYRGYDSLTQAFKYVWMQMYLLLHDVKDIINAHNTDYLNQRFYVDSKIDEKTVLWMIYPIDKLSKQEYLDNYYAVESEWCPDGFFDTDFNWEEWNQSMQDFEMEYRDADGLYIVFDNETLEKVFISRSEEKAHAYLDANPHSNLKMIADYETTFSDGM